jgi:concanavalin A-like lectin/glucanase superfamily protein/parallel beta helix pectate lyase-like protein
VADTRNNLYNNNPRPNRLGHLILALLALLVLLLLSAPGVRAGTLVISGQSNKTYSGLQISTTSGDCVDIINSTNITIENSNIGPCGTNNTTNPSNGIYIQSGNGIDVFDSYIHVQNRSTGCCDSHDGIFINYGSNDLIQGNVVAYNETNIQTFHGSNNTITGNFLLNPQGPFPRGGQIQDSVGSTATITNNFLLSTPDTTLGPAVGTSNAAPIPYGQDNTGNRPSDNLSIYATQNATVENNYITGGLDANTPGSGGDQSPSGCGLISDGSVSLGSNNASFINNILVNTGGCAIGIATGTNQTVTGNLSISLNSNGGGQTADYIWNQYPPACGPVLLSGNIGTLIRSDDYASGYWNGGGCGPVTCDGTNRNIDSCNTFDYGSTRTAYNALTIDPAVKNPPLIPPLPKNCVADSPYSTQTSLAPCSLTSTPTPARISWWKLNSSGGITAIDSAGSSPGTLNHAATWVTGGILGRNAVSVGDRTFDNNGGRVSFPINLPPSFTLYFWSKATAYGAKLDASGAYNNLILGGEVYLTNGFRAGFTPAGLFSFWTSQSGGTLTLSDTTDAPSRTWEQYAITYSAGIGRLYRNGALGASGSGTYVPGTTGMGIDSGVGGVAQFYGLVDQVRLYNFALSGTAITDLYNSDVNP